GVRPRDGDSRSVRPYRGLRLPGASPEDAPRSTVRGAALAPHGRSCLVVDGGRSRLQARGRGRPVDRSPEPTPSSPELGLGRAPSGTGGALAMAAKGINNGTGLPLSARNGRNANGAPTDPARGIIFAGGPGRGLPRYPPVVQT